MSRIGKQPIIIPDGVDVGIDADLVRVKGPKGKLERRVHAEIQVVVEDDRILVQRRGDLPTQRALHGLTRSLIANMVTGVVDGFEKSLDVVGTGYRAEQDGAALVLQVGFSHPVRFDPPDGIEYVVEERGKRVRVRGIDKEAVGQVAVNIRGVRPPEPYKGKGIRYVGEHVAMKAGKAGKAKA